MKNFVVAHFIILFSVFLFAEQNQAAPNNPLSIVQNRNTISGFVFDGQKSPVAGVYVELQNEIYSVLARIKTNGSGHYAFGGLSSGRFYIRVLSTGTNFEEQTQEVEIVNVVIGGRASSENAQKDFYLRARRNEKENKSINGVIFVQDVPEKADKFYRKAIAELDDNKIEVGIADLQNAIEIFPDYYLALEKLGGEFIKQQKYEQAQKIFQRAVAVNSRSYSGWYGLSFASYGLKQSETAVEAAEKAVSLDPESVEAFLILGISERQAKRFENAEKTLRQGDKLTKGKNADIHWNLALLYAHNLNRYKDAADELELYLKTAKDIENAAAIRKLIKQFRAKSAEN